MCEAWHSGRSSSLALQLKQPEGTPGWSSTLEMLMFLLLGLAVPLWQPSLFCSLEAPDLLLPTLQCQSIWQVQARYRSAGICARHGGLVDHSLHDLFRRVMLQGYPMIEVNGCDAS